MSQVDWEAGRGYTTTMSPASVAEGGALISGIGGLLNAAWKPMMSHQYV